MQPGSWYVLPVRREGKGCDGRSPKPAGLPGVGLIALLISGAVFGAEPPVAMVMTVSGVTTPAVEAMDELSGGASLRLDPDTRLSFLPIIRRSDWSRSPAVRCG